MSSAFEPIRFPCGLGARNRLMLAPMTNCQSRADGAPSAEDLRWLGMRAGGGFGTILTAAAYVHKYGQGFPGQLGIDSDALLPELSRLAEELHRHDTVALVQLYHAGMRALPAVSKGPLLAPSDDGDSGARAMTRAEVRSTIGDFIDAAERAKKAGFDGIELHAAHTYLLHEFLSSQFNRRDDEYGGDADGRCRMLLEILKGIRERCGAGFAIGVRLSPEALMITLEEALEAYRRVVDSGAVDFVDLSMWDVSKQPAEEEYAGRPLLDYFTGVPRGDTLLGVAGKLYAAADVSWALEHGADFVLPGRGAILHHDFPLRVRQDPGFVSTAPPVSETYLRDEGVSDAFIQYIRSSWPDFISP